MEIRHTTPIERDPTRLREAMPWYLNGTLEESDRAWVEQMLAAGAGDAQAELDFDRGLAQAFEQRLAEVPADVGWAGLLKQVRSDAAATVEGRAGGGAGIGIGAGTGAGGGAAPADSWPRRLMRLLSLDLSPRLGMAMAVLVAVQAVAIGILVTDRGGPDTVEYRSGAGVRPVAAIRALLNESITEKALREALTANGATIVDGPNPLGEYWIVTAAGDPDAVARTLRDAGVIASYVIDQRQQGR